ncbi:hypothetical protein B0H11DRAFT_1923853 [Mycena galericulata]|nr:hypothetical protein B0H11DRAFT_1923853 [Mycena galericulata]
MQTAHVGFLGANKLWTSAQEEKFPASGVRDGDDRVIQEECLLSRRDAVGRALCAAHARHPPDDHLFRVCVKPDDAQKVDARAVKDLGEDARMRAGFDRVPAPTRRRAGRLAAPRIAWKTGNGPPAPSPSVLRARPPRGRRVRATTAPEHAQVQTSNGCRHSPRVSARAPSGGVRVEALYMLLSPDLTRITVDDCKTRSG